ncbi:MAG TPA: DUF3857 domain-containing protein [Gemmatimonadales bacterium]|nr:DUF3857 domain-containing protein [Gemmatimonadales bacterium]
MRRILLPALLLACIRPVSAQTAYRIGSSPSWVKMHKPNLTMPPVRTEGWEYVLTDRQESVGPAGIERYWHAAYRVIDQAAVGDNSQLEIVFDSAYQRLTLHTVTVWRGGRALDQLNRSHIHVAQREADLEDQIFDGSLTVVVVLEDVRPGDIIEYSYTRAGSNPVFRGHYMAAFQFQYDVPMAEQYVRLLWRRSRPVRLHALGTPPQPTITGEGGLREYEWAQRNVRAQVVETDVPDWFVPYGTIQVTDFGSWHEVGAWGDSLFADATLPPAVRDVVERIRSGSESDERRALQALRWVQDEIRYTGVEIGVNSHQPYSPAVVVKRRYGDCKDKALLLITMLRALGITARPSLVSTTYGGHVGDYAPTAALFDHAIVELELNGREYWIDPTDVDQRGAIADVTAYYGAALVLGGSADSLSTMPDLQRPEPTTDIVVSFDVGSLDEPTSMHVETRYSGRSANTMRSSIRGSREELRRSYTEYYAKLYPSIRSEQPPEVIDDESRNELRTEERYTIPDFWSGDSTKERTGKFEPLELSSRIPQATALERHMPLAINHRGHIRYVINARFKKGWAIPSRQERIETPAARFSYDKHVKGNVLTLSYDYETLSDHVKPEAAAAHIKDMARAADLLSYRVRAPANVQTAPGALNWPVLLAGLFAVAIACMAAVRVSRSELALARAGSVTADTPMEVCGDPVGLGGWLVLVGIGVTLSPLRILLSIAKTLPSYSASTWAVLTTPGTDSYQALWAPLLLSELVMNIALLVFACLLAYLYYARKKQFPIVFIGVMCGSVLINLLDAVFTGLLPVSESASTNRAVIVQALIWIPYMLRSRRVRNTFVN